MKKATQADAIELCKILSHITPHYGAYVALTGGCLYEEGARKDMDILIYRHRDKKIKWGRLWLALADAGIEMYYDHGWCKKARWKGFSIDFFDPESDGEYPDGASTGDSSHDLPELCI